MRKKYHVSPNIPRLTSSDKGDFVAGCLSAAYIALLATVAGFIAIWVAAL